MKKLLSPWWLLVIAMAGTSALVYLYGWGEIFATNDKAEKLGQLGDFFGGLLNPLVSILTLFVAISVWRKAEKFRRLRNSIDEWTLSTFSYFLVLHPDGAQYQTAAAAAHALTNLRIQRALSFAKAYLPGPTYSLPTQEQ